jgi:flagellar biosynthesis component FlhA
VWKIVSQLSSTVKWEPHAHISAEVLLAIKKVPFPPYTIHFSGSNLFRFKEEEEDEEDKEEEEEKEEQEEEEEEEEEDGEEEEEEEQEEKDEEEEKEESKGSRVSSEMDIQFIRAEDERAYPYLEAGF